MDVVDGLLAEWLGRARGHAADGLGLCAQLDKAVTDLVGGDAVHGRVVAEEGLELAEGVVVVGDGVRAEARKKWAKRDSNPRPHGCEPCALTD